MRPSLHPARKRALLVAALSVAALATTALTATATPALAGPGTDLPDAVTVQQAAEAAPLAPLTLPHTTITNPDGSVEEFVDDAVIEQLELAAASGDQCGNACDGRDPAGYLVQAPGGPSRYYYCSTDAVTKYRKTVDNSTYAELRYSPRCRTAWTRGGYYSLLAGFSYRSNGDERKRVIGPSSHQQGVSRYTAMLNDAGYRYAACVDGQIGGSPLWRCTTRY